MPNDLSDGKQRKDNGCKSLTWKENKKNKYDNNPHCAQNGRKIDSFITSLPDNKDGSRGMCS